MQRGWLLTLLVLSLLLPLAASAATDDAPQDPSSSFSSAAAAAAAASSAESEPVLALPEPPAGGSNPSVQLGEAIKFDHLGPMIVNADGTVSRIANWDQLSEHERNVALRRIAKRNRERIDALKAQQEQEQAETKETA